MKQRHRLNLLLLAALILVSAQVAMGQTAQLAGNVRDASHSVIPNAQITVINEENGFKRTASSNEQGYYTVPFLSPGSHRVLVQSPGFQTISQSGIKLNVGQNARIDFILEVGQVRQSVLVRGELDAVQESASVGALVNREWVEHLPLKERSVRTLFELAPGVVASKGYGVEEGQYSVNGQRLNANNLMIDGVSANLGAIPNPALNQPAGVALPSLPPQTGVNHFATPDEVQEVRLQTSGYAPEFGRTPGEQIAISTRAGTNEWHGGLFDYFRDERLQANNWFAKRRALPKAPLRQQDFGAFVGGPLVKDRTFCFASYEGEQAREPRVLTRVVPSLKARQNAAPAIRPLLQAFPLPNGAELGNERTEFSATFANPSQFDAVSLRIDHPVSGKQSLFGRYSSALSELEERLGGLNTINTTHNRTATLTVGATGYVTRWLNHDLRFNWSISRGASTLRMDEFGGASPLHFSTAPPTALYGFYLLDATSLLSGANAANGQRQFNLVENFSTDIGAHQLKFGVDYRRLVSTFDSSPYQQIAVFNSVNEATAGKAAFVQVSSAEPHLAYAALNLSAFVQDNWRATPRLTFTYGLRWEFNPPPAASSGPAPYAVSGLGDPGTLALAPHGTPIWRSTWRNFAPRLGAAYRLSPLRGWETALRGGVGLFYDLGNGQALSGASVSFPSRVERVLIDIAFPLTSALAEAPRMDLNPPYGPLFVFDPRLLLPYTLQWNLALEQALGPHQTFSVAYVAAAGRRLLRQEQWRNPNPNFTTIFVTGNTAASDYHALQLQFQRRLARGLQALASYTWAHTLDNASDDSSRSLPASLIDLRQDRGPSAFDVRHVFSAALTAELPAPRSNKLLSTLLEHWSLDAFVRLRSATPLNIITGTDVLGAGLSDVSRPDLVAGAPLWITDASVAGGRRINRTAFAIPIGRQGTLGRNALRGFGLAQIDLAVRRQFNLTERWKLQLVAESFNLLNRANFGDPVNRLDRAQFGQTLYQAGDPRSVNLAVKIQF